MRYLGLIAVVLFSSFAHLAVAGVSPPCPSSTCYVEQGDAGDRFNPQNLTGGPYQAIQGDIGGTAPKDQFDAFRFFFGGGNLLAVFESSVPIELRLFTDALAEIIPNLDGPTFETWGPLSAANYILEVEALIDPPFSIGLFGPTINPISPPIAPAAVPEPGVLVLSLLGLAALVMSRRRIRA